jgi:hypothetical protein
VKAVRWCFILFQCVWLNAILPGHTRGVVTLPGTQKADARESHACCAGASESDSPDERTPPQAPTPKQRGGCAVCFFAAHMATPPPALASPVALGLLETLPAHAPATARSVDFPFAYLGRGPPLP